MSPDHPPQTPASGSASSARADFAGSVQGDAPSPTHSRPRVPDAIERRYLHVNNLYFFPDRTLAFADDGDRIRVATENSEVLHTVVAIAEARGWRVIALKGTEPFRQGMWREAALRGIEARGYEPTPSEILQVQRARSNWHPRHGTGQGPRPQAASPSREAASAREGSASAEPSRSTGIAPPDAVQTARSLREGTKPPVTGMLLAAAAAPYQFDPAQRMSFYVTVRTEVGDRTTWGADLERALAESASQPRIGDAVVLTQHGTRAVSIRVPVRNAEGELVGEKKIVAQRARWSIETPEHLRAMVRRAALVRSGELLSETGLTQHPQLATTAAALKLAEQYAQRVTTDPASQQRLVELIRERMADALARGQEIHLRHRRTPPTPMHLRQQTGRGLQELSRERF